MTEQIKQWITDFAAFGEPSVDALDAGKGCGLFPMGKKVLAQREDILGVSLRSVRYHWRLKVHLPKDPRLGDDRGAAMLAALDDWLTVVSGNRVCMENARLAAQDGAMARYEAELYLETEI